MRQGRSGITLFDLLAILAILAVLLALLLPAVAKVRQAANRAQSSNNLKQQVLAVHNYHDVNGKLPSGRDDKGFSAAALLLPYIEQDNVFKGIDFTKSIDDKANAKMRGVIIRTFLSPNDPLLTVKNGWGATNYLYNDKLCSLNSKVKFTDITDGLSNTVIIGETLKGDNGKKAVSVQRQYVLLDKKALKDLKDDAGVEDFKDDKHIAGDRCASWMDGHFLQGTFNGRLRPNDKRPDVSCAGEGGVSALRSFEKVVLVALADGSVRSVSQSISEKTWRDAIDPADGNALGDDW